MSLTSQVEALKISSHARGEILRLDKCISIDQRAGLQTKLQQVLRIFFLAETNNHLLRSIYGRHIDLVLNPPSMLYEDFLDTATDQRTHELDQLFMRLPGEIYGTVRETLKSLDPRIPAELAVAQMIWVLVEEGLEAKEVQAFFETVLNPTQT